MFFGENTIFLLIFTTKITNNFQIYRQSLLDNKNALFFMIVDAIKHGKNQKEINGLEWRRT